MRLLFLIAALALMAPGAFAEKVLAPGEQIESGGEIYTCGSASVSSEKLICDEDGNFVYQNRTRLERKRIVAGPLMASCGDLVGKEGVPLVNGASYCRPVNSSESYLMYVDPRKSAEPKQIGIYQIETKDCQRIAAANNRRAGSNVVCSCRPYDSKYSTPVYYSLTTGKTGEGNFVISHEECVKKASTCDFFY